MEVIRSIDHALFLFLNASIANPFFDAFFLAITNERFWLIPALVAAFFFIRNEKKAALVALLLMVVSITITDPVCYRIIKPLVHRLRPCNPEHFIEGGRFLLGMKTSLSFPSNHAANMMGIGTVLSLLYPHRKFWFLLIAVLVAFSRVYIGVHFPIDVAAGACIGAGVGFFVVFVYRRLQHSLDTKKSWPFQPFAPV